ncbi:MAG: PorP/SprF family type IX secretion system membrane protein [Paludibacteraceae bacterium]|nr:PorP/SprF family type IX secretion system membrane protein [Paludibacteraceae bacterium]MBO7637257.1 PorP/SprF family type IX secretion system membrane protein [Paludibacteraceae bacterium]
MKKYIFTIFTLLFSVSVFAQRDLMLSQQFFSRVNMNPSATGNTDDVDIFLLGRWQWIGLDDSPKSGVLNLTNYFDKVRSGIGFTASYDDLGIASRTLNVKAAYAYHLNLNESILMSFGLSAGILHHYLDPQRHRYLDPEELEKITLNHGDKLSEVKPDMDFGVELAMPKFMFGASVNHLLNNEEMVTTTIPGRQFNWYIRGLFSCSETFDLAPALIYTHRNKTNRAELNLMMFYKRFVWWGFTYRPDLNGTDNFSSHFVHMNVGLEYKKFRVGYAFELGLGDVANSLSRNASEIMLSFRIEKTSNKGARFLED